MLNSQELQSKIEITLKFKSYCKRKESYREGSSDKQMWFEYLIAKWATSV